MDLSLAREYDHYSRLPALGLGNGSGLVPRLLGHWPEKSLGLLLEAVPGPDLDHLLLKASVYGDPAPFFRAWKNWCICWPSFIPGWSGSGCAGARPGLPGKVTTQLLAAGLLTREDRQALAHERHAWEERFQDFSGPAGLIHGDATPTNFLFPNGRAVALDLERLESATASGTCPGWPGN